MTCRRAGSAQPTRCGLSPKHVQVLQALQQSLEEVKVERDTARTYLDEVKTQASAAA